MRNYEMKLPPDGTSSGCRKADGSMWWACKSEENKPGIAICVSAGNMITPPLYRVIAVFETAEDRDLVLRIHRLLVAKPLRAASMPRVVRISKPFVMPAGDQMGRSKVDLDGEIYPYLALREAIGVSFHAWQIIHDFAMEVANHILKTKADLNDKQEGPESDR